MILTGVSLNTNGQWEKKQRTPEIQIIIILHRAHFEFRDSRWVIGLLDFW